MKLIQLMFEMSILFSIIFIYQISMNYFLIPILDIDVMQFNQLESLVIFVLIFMLPMSIPSYFFINRWMKNMENEKNV